MNPATLLLQPPRPTTATTASAPPTSYNTHPRPSPPPLGAPSFASVGPLPNLLPIFRRNAQPLPGTVKIRVEETTFWCHREVLLLASPFFEAVILGEWTETSRRGKRESRGPVDTDVVTEAALPPTTPTGTSDPLDVPPTDSSDTSETPHSPPSPSPQIPSTHSSRSPSYVEYSTRDRESIWEDDDEEGVVCRLDLPEEKASSFQDLLCHLYPRLECLISWNNAGDLIAMARKFDIPSLRNACVAFLLPSAAGNPIKSMKIAEDNNMPELYKEASRYVLDGYQNWPVDELAQLTEATLLKLERRRSWFLERLLKLSLIQTSRDYVCQPTCPDPTLCARLVDEKWKSALASASRFGTPQPSIIYRSLRSLEPSLSSPALHLPHTACQAHARLYVADIFDRLFGISITAARSWGSLTMNGTSGAGGYGRTFGAGGDGVAKNSWARYFLSVEMSEKKG